MVKIQKERANQSVIREEEKDEKTGNGKITSCARFYRGPENSVLSEKMWGSREVKRWCFLLFLKLPKAW